MADESDNPFDALLALTGNDPTKIQERYQNHRTNRNEQQKQKLLDPSFTAFSPDLILANRLDKDKPDYVDPRHCLVLWARPTESVKDLIELIQAKLITEFPHLWLMPRPNQHTTTMEVTHSRTEEEIAPLVSAITPSAERLTNYSYDHRARLVKPLLGFDASAIALTFVPAAGEALSGCRTLQDDTYTHSHLRRDLFNECEKAGVSVGSRYVLETAHLTVARFVDEKDFKGSDDAPLKKERVERLVCLIEEINEWLENEYWPKEDGIKAGGEWIVGQERGLDLQFGQLWYGDGVRVAIGKGFEF